MTAQNFTVDNGITVTGTGGNITGATNIEASGNIVAHVFSGADEYSNPIILAPSLADYANLKYMRIRAGDDDSHIHYDSGNNAQYDLYYGDDFKYFKVGANGNVYIGNWAPGPGSVEWQFDPLGNLSVPPNSSITTANATGGGGGHSVTIQAGASDANTWNSNPGGDLILRGGYGSFGDGGGGPGGNVYIYGGASSDTAPGNVIVDSGGYNWTFDNSGNLTLSDGNIIATGNIFAPAIVQNGAYNTSVALSSSTGIIEANTGGNATQFLPGGTVRLSASGSGQIISGTFDGSGITLGSGQTDLFQTRGGNVTIQVGTGGTTSNTWTFNNNGNLTLPGNTFSVNYANGTPVSISGGGGTYGDSNVATLLSSFGSNTVSTTGNVTAGNLKTNNNLVFTANTSNIVFNNTAYINGSGNAVGRDGSIMLVPYTGAGSSFPGVVIGGAGRIIAPNGSVHQVLNASDVTFQVAVKAVATAATSTTTGGIQAGGGIGVVGNAYIGGALVRDGAVSTAAWGTSGAGLKLPAAQYTDTTSSGTVATVTGIHGINGPTIAASSSTTYTNLTTVYIGNAPALGTNASATNRYSLYVTQGSYFASTTTSTSTTTGAVVVAGGVGVAGNIYAGGDANIAGNVTVSGTGGISIPNLPAFRVYGNTSSFFGPGTITNQAVDYNQGSSYTNSTGIFTAPVAGIYQTSGTLRVGSNNGLNQAAVLRNGATLTTGNQIAFWEINGNSATAHMAFSGFAKLAVGDTLRLQVITGNVQFDSNDSWGVTFLG